MTNLPRLSLSDRGWLILAALLVTAAAFLSNDPTGLVECVMSLSLVEMHASGEWLIPTVGGVAWSDASPLVQWMAGLFLPLTRDPILALRASGLLGLILASQFTAELAAQCGGRRCGVLAGVILVTTFGLAGDIVAGGHLLWLTAASTAVLRLLAGIESEFRHSQARSPRSVPCETLTSARSGRMLALFLLVGVISIAAEVASLMAVILIPVCGWLLLRRSDAKKKYLWAWGGIGFIVMAATWPTVVSIRTGGGHYLQQWFQPESTGEWSPLKQSMELLECTLPWGLLIPLGMWVTRHEALGDGDSRERLIWSHSLLCPLAVLILRPQHTQDALASAGAWSILAALGLESLIDSVTMRLNFADRDGVRHGTRCAAAGTACMMAAVLVQSEGATRTDTRTQDVVTAVQRVDPHESSTVSITRWRTRNEHPDVQVEYASGKSSRIALRPWDPVLQIAAESARTVH